MRDTPRTNEALDYQGGSHADCITRLERLIVVARQLERELRESRATVIKECMKVAEQAETMWSKYLAQDDLPWDVRMNYEYRQDEAARISDAIYALGQISPDAAAVQDSTEAK